MKPDKKLLAIYYSPRGYWKGLTAIKKRASAAKVTEQQAKDWLKKQTIWQIYLPAPRHKRRRNLTWRCLLFLPHDRVRQKTFRYALTVVYVASRYKETEPLTSKTAAEGADGLARIYKRSLISFKLTLGSSSWATSVSCWRSTLYRFGAVGLTSTGTKASWSASTGRWLNAFSGASMPRRCDYPPVNGPQSG